MFLEKSVHSITRSTAISDDLPELKEAFCKYFLQEIHSSN